MIDRFFSALYRRFGPRYLDVMIAAMFVVVLALTVVNVAGGLLYLHASPSQFVRLLIVGELCMLVGAAVWVPLVRSKLQPLRRWASGRTTAVDAESAWRTIVVDLPRAVATAAAITAAAGVPAEIYATVLLDLAWWWALLACAGITGATACGAVLAYLLSDAACAPVAREVALAKPLAPDAELRGVSMSAKLLVLPPVVSFYAVMLAAGLARDSLGPAGRLAVGFGSALALTLTVSLAGTLLLRRSLVGPVDALVEAAARAGAGDLEGAVPPQAEDELGVLTNSFNRMLEGLRERESLRTQNVELDAALRESLEDVRESRARIVTASDAARRRVERDLHDGAQQHLVLLNLKLALVKRAVENDPNAAAMVDEARADLGRALEQLRDLAHGIYPALLESDGLPGALADAVERATIPVRLECDGTGRYPPELEAAVYFCCLEALQNAAKHAGERTRATVRLAERDATLVFSVADNGRGYDTATIASSAGLQNMADRIGALGGSLRTDSSPGAGTTVSGSIPLAS